MKKTIISIIGIAVMLLAITACRPNYVIVPIPGGGTSSTPSGTPVSDAGELQEALAKGEDVYLTKDVVLPEGFQIPENSTIDGDDKTYAVQAGRELRVMVKPEEVDDLSAHKIARKIKEKIEEQLQYPGTIKVTVIRETRATEEAK